MTKFVDLNLYQPIQIRTYFKTETAHAAGYDLKVAERTVIATRRNRPRPNWGQGLYASG